MKHAGAPSRPRKWLKIAAILPVGLLLWGVAAGEEEFDPPDRVARLSYVQGDVSIATLEGESEQAELNRPLTTGDGLDVGDRSRAELQTDVASLHIGERSSLSLLTLDDQTLAMRLIDGELVMNVRELRDGDSIEIETGNARVSIMRPGEYRIAAEDGGATTIVGVRDGGAEIESGSQIFSLHPSQEGRYTGTSSVVEDIRSVGPRDDLEAWADQRNAPEERSTSARYVSRDVIGYEDLDYYGTWETDSYYGSVWYPTRISAGWAPYRFGRWAYIGPWGWTWIDQAPWGFAPFHYGRWTYLRSRWCWVPGPRHVRPVYAPALVGWKSRGSGYAWFPLGPREVYVPRHRASDRYVRQVNVSNTTIVNVNQITNIHRNRIPQGRFMNERLANDVKVIPRQTFTNPPRQIATRDRPPVRYVDKNAASDSRGREVRAVRPSYQPPRMIQAPPGKDDKPEDSKDRPSSREPTRDRESSSLPGRALPGRTLPSQETPGRQIPTREIPRGNLPYRTGQPDRSPSSSVDRRTLESSMPRDIRPSSGGDASGSGYRTLPPPSRTVPPPPSSRSTAPPPRTIDRAPRSSGSSSSAPPPRSSPPPRSYSPPSTTAPPQRRPIDRPDRGKQN